MIKYHTEQRKRLLEFFIKHSNEQLTVDTIAKSIDNISISSIYRNVNKMVKDGLLRRFQKEGSTNFFYHYVGSEECNEHFHLKCCGCGSILHMHSVFSDELIDMIHKSMDFNLDKSTTMLFGYCKACDK